ncbi:winged helix-turn-helix transcriptional regulator [Nocardioides campestrisoli]|uniref:winged helix-turn-helix transcriptional regulator n=1 Tax=Nocardioides campestrisoli TaxID=2736757 RepID=UPI00163D5042|nr:helix-turn-helix domain-containing protein [Nocardioides campestrisoli]
MTSYGQFCPVAKAMEILDERWTLLVVRELLAGSTRFNELRRGNPKMSSALLATRLRTLERVGVVDRLVDEHGRGSYRLTSCGEELRPVVEGLGAWGMRWIGQLGAEDLDPHLLMWDVKRTVTASRWPPGRTVVEFRFHDVPARAARWWLCVGSGEVDACDVDPGFDVDLVVLTSLRTMVELWRGDRAWRDAERADELTVQGPPALARGLKDLLGTMPLGAVPRPV